MAESKELFIVLTMDGAHFGYTLFSDLSDYHSTEFDAEVVEIEDSPSFIRRVILHFFLFNNLGIRIRSHIKTVFRSISPFLTQIRALLSTYHHKHRTIVFTNAAAILFKADFYVKLKKQTNNTLALFLYDTIDNLRVTRPEIIELIKSNSFDLIYTFSSDDAEKYGFISTMSYFSSIVDQNNNAVTNKLFYVGAGKNNRNQVLSSMSACLEKRNMPYFFSIVSGVPQNKKIVSSSVLYDKIMPYSNVIEYVKRANCILEIIDEGAPMTLRYFEAVVLNKKLLSNNPKITSLPYYDHRYMRYFKNIEDIDWEWVNADEIVDYAYKGEFSPVFLMKQIKQSICKA